jgi:hypothetical protein
MYLSQFTSFRLLLGLDGQSFTGLITYPAGLVFVPDSNINQLLNWKVCFLCEKKTFKKDRKLKKIESTDRRNNLRESAVFKNDQIAPACV